MNRLVQGRPRVVHGLAQTSVACGLSPARGPSLWDDCNAQMGEGVKVQPDWDLAAQPAPDYNVDQRINW